ncbi:unnamed protein product [Tetraodon nigroviridis]|uniref:(spotted green pufferfish) hypothetical protein n=1 Tax=Tetraodon nigroviridis TaxID=99883 RepID=Q4S6N2_TETNG|nr:unnamed protein product [Tetraodon nigroviridis]
MFYSMESNHLSVWGKEVRNGYVQGVLDEETQSSTIELHGINTRTTYITCPPDPKDSLGIRLPFLNLLLKKTGEDFSFEITVSTHTIHVWVINIDRQHVNNWPKSERNVRDRFQTPAG